MDRLITFFDKVLPLTLKDKAYMRSHLCMRNLKKGELFFEKGKICNEIGFVVDGILRVTHINENGDELIRYFINEGHFAVDLESYSNQIPSQDNLEALSDVQLVIMSRTTMALCGEQIPNFNKIVSILTEKALLEKYNNKSQMLLDDAPTRYNKLISRHPDIIQRVSSNHIAAFLGISPFTLSRIRNNLK